MFDPVNCKKIAFANDFVILSVVYTKKLSFMQNLLNFHENDIIYKQFQKLNKEKVVTVMNNMKTIVKEKVLQNVAKIAYHSAEQNANTSCVFWHYQPQLPEAVKKLRRF